ncbi:MAG: DNA repair exonuclease [Chromatiales bacterium]|nr:DNA repair exonuclease [Chromatiales bacterium]
MHFLHAADLHIDSPLRGLDRYEGAPLERLRGATRGALERLVDAALAASVDFLLLVGDIYDRDWPDFHTGLYFREQMVRLNRADIPVFLIHGNHDAQGVISRELVLPDNVRVFSSRKAETHVLEALGVAIHGRSFPNRAVDDDLVPGYPAPVPGLFNIGLLHTSLTGRAGHDPYAPTSEAVLRAKGYDYWALGHVHARERVGDDPPIIYPGNLQGRHARETGPKGCESVRVDAAGVQIEFLPLDVVRWHHLHLNIDGHEGLSGLQTEARRGLSALVEGAEDRLHAVRVTLSGVSPLQTVEAAKPETLEATVRAAAQDTWEAEVWIESVRSELHSPLDRARESEREDAIGELLRLADAIAADDSQLSAFAESELSALVEKIPDEILAAEEQPLAPETLRSLLREAEETVLARLVADEPAS